MARKPDVTNNGTSMLAIVDGQGYQYSHGNLSLVKSDKFGPDVFQWAAGYSTAIDPAKDTMYVLGVRKDGDTLALLSADLINTPGSDDLRSLTVDGESNSATWKPRMFTSAWSILYKMMVVLTDQGLYMVNPSNNSIKGVNTTWSHGDISTPTPTALKDSCFVSAMGGTKMILFGGFSQGTLNATDDLFILDMSTKEWSAGLKAPEKRAKAACVYTNGFLIVYGGLNNLASGYVNTAMVYDVVKDTWGTYYNPSQDPVSSTYIPTSSPDPSQPTVVASRESKGLDLKLPIILGCVLSILVVMLVILGYVLYRSHKNMAQDNHSRNEKPRSAAAAAGTTNAGFPVRRALDSNMTVVAPPSPSPSPYESASGIHEKGLYVPGPTYGQYQPQTSYLQPPTPPAAAATAAAAIAAGAASVSRSNRSSGSFLEPHQPKGQFGIPAAIPVARSRSPAPVPPPRSPDRRQSNMSVSSSSPSTSDDSEGLQYLTIYNPGDSEYHPVSSSITLGSETSTPTATPTATPCSSVELTYVMSLPRPPIPPRVPRNQAPPPPAYHIPSSALNQK
ncbi:hypothetical protein BGX31_003625 [Mortierella sp. GBA43]|nr:hypothetical protein BGX31_003625 [Mortierella sp. GBA43]